MRLLVAAKQRQTPADLVIVRKRGSQQGPLAERQGFCRRRWRLHDCICTSQGQSGDNAYPAQYEARKYGVRSGMAGFIAKKLCPHLILWVDQQSRWHQLTLNSVKNNFADYSAASRQVLEVLARVSAHRSVRPELIRFSMTKTLPWPVSTKVT